MGNLCLGSAGRDVEVRRYEAINTVKQRKDNVQKLHGRQDGHLDLRWQSV